MIKFNAGGSGHSGLLLEVVSYQIGDCKCDASTETSQITAYQDLYQSRGIIYFFSIDSRFSTLIILAGVFKSNFVSLTITVDSVQTESY